MVPRTQPRSSCLSRPLAPAPRTLMLTVLLHTDRPITPPPPQLALALRTGWWAHEHNASVAHEQKRFSTALWRSWSIHQVHKYEWALETAIALDAAIVMLIDSDVITQCDAPELLRRWALFNTSLLIGAESNWWPRKDPSRDPFEPNEPARYPNSGLMIGTRAGLEALVASLRAMPSFPCCPAPFRSRPDGLEPTKCLVEDQGCLQTALMSGTVPHRLDSQRRLFWNVGYTHPSQFALTHDGRKITRRPRAGRGQPKVPSDMNLDEVPCVLHFNGGPRAKWAARLLAARVVRNAYAKTDRGPVTSLWMPAASPR